MQTKKQSLIEAFVNILIGYTVAILSQIVIFPWFGIHIALKDDLIIGLYFTAISIIRTYAVRRYYNFKHRGKNLCR
jgi:hypothetical protein